MADPRWNPNFGNGQVGGDNNWTPPVYGVIGETGQPVTVSFGQGYREGHTGIASGHIPGGQYYGPNGHDHYGPQGQVYGDRGALR
jgi:hypothetical protein